MKKSIIGLLGLLAVICVCSGCNKAETQPEADLAITSIAPSDEIWDREADMEAGTMPEDTFSEKTAIVPENIPETDTTVEVWQTELNSQEKIRVESELDESRIRIGLTEDTMEELHAGQAGNYYYQCLSVQEQLLYVEMYQTLTCFEKNILITTKDENILDRVYQAVINDHPEIFYTKGYSYTKNTIEDEIVYITFSGNYTCTKEEATGRIQQIEQIAEQILANISSGADEYDKVKYVYEYIIRNTDYGEFTQDHQNICSVFLDKASVCNGYAKSMQYLLNKAGVSCILVNGVARESHAWNIVKIDGAYYHVDVTWGDPSYNSSEDAQMNTPDIDYSYLCMPMAQIGIDHIPSDAFPLPLCESIKDNYFVREGLYLTAYQESELQNIFLKAAQNGRKDVCIKAADTKVYTELIDRLITRQEIFGYIENSGQDVSTLAYSQNEQLLTLRFWY